MSLRIPNHIVVEQIIFEAVERVARMSLHLQELHVALSSPSGSQEQNTDHTFIAAYQECLDRIVQTTVAFGSRINNIGEKLNDAQLKEALETACDLISLMASLHIELNHLPRPEAPVELRRFARLLDKHSVKLGEPEKEGHAAISIYIDEMVSDGTYANGPLSEFRDAKLDPILNQIANRHSLDAITHSFNGPVLPDGFHITIPRIEASNPCRWPTLVHELAHSVMSKKFFKSECILKDFESMYSDKNLIKAIEEDIPSINLKSWLTECWCDLFGAFVMGPAFWFAQYAAFLFTEEPRMLGEVNVTHPPALFRLHLIRRILSHRAPSELREETLESMRICQEVIGHLDAMSANGFSNSIAMRTHAQYFLKFFLQHFFPDQNDDKVIAEYLEKRLAYSEIKAKTVDLMVNRISLGYPIPSVRTATEPIEERPSTVQEILIAAWDTRNGVLKTGTLKDLHSLTVKATKADLSIEKVFRLLVERRVKEFNFAVLRSIQISEWMALLNTPPSTQDLEVSTDFDIARDDTGCRDNNDSIPNAILADHEIKKYLTTDAIGVYPIVCIDEQIGSSSLDIRLGTSFQIFYPNLSGVVDFTEDSTSSNLELNTRFLDLDYLGNITIAPGQFVLAHSLEFLKLPPDIAAEVEGRSSFARLGLEVHMTAGFIDPGFVGVLTYELFNAGPNALRLYPGMRIAQLRFFRCGITDEPYNINPTAKYKGHLAHRHSLQSLDYEIRLIRAEKAKGESI